MNRDLFLYMKSWESREGYKGDCSHILLLPHSLIQLAFQLLLMQIPAYQNASPLYRHFLVFFFFFPNLELEGKLRQQEQVCVGPYPPIFGSLRALAQVQRRELLAQLSFQMSSDHLLLAQGSRTLSAFTRSRTWVGYIHHLQQLLPDTQTRCAHQRPTMEGIMLKLILPVLTFMLLPEVGDFQGGKEIDQSLESWVLVPVLKLSSCVNSIITLLQ